MVMTKIIPGRMRHRIALLTALAICLPITAGADEVRLDTGEVTVSANVMYGEENELSGTVFLLLHGTLAHKDMEIMATLQSVLQESGYSSLAINLSLNVDDRHGFYDCAVPHTHRAEDALDELDTWIAWLEEQGADRVILLGHSRGANQVARYAAAKTGSEGLLIGGTILLAPSTGAGDAVALDEASRATADEWLPQKIDFLHCRDAQVSVASYLSYMGPNSNADTLAVLEKLQVPTLVISGTADTVVPELPQRMAKINNAAVAYAQIDGADHFFRDLFAYDVVDAITEFISDRENRENANEKPDARLITLATALRADGDLSASRQKPIMIMFSQHGCQFCELLRQQVLFPMIRAGRLADRLIVREISLDADFSLTDFSGRELEGREFARRYDVYITPTLLFLDGEGQQLADPIVGTGNIEYYGFYLERAIAAAAAGL